jgi:hypothetical protein
MSGDERSSSATTPAAEGDAPRDALADVWGVLDVLPRASGAVDMASTTVAMVAVSIDEPRRAGAVVRRWLLPATAVAASLVAGVVVGWATAPEVKGRRGGDLALVGHLDLLREAGSVSFLEEVAQRKYPMPSRPGPLRNPEARRADADEFMAEIAALGRELVAAAGGSDRESREPLSPERQVELTKSATTFGQLSAAEKKLLDATARALVARPELRQAALLWHQWLSIARPEDRDGIIAKPSEGRLDWLDWYASRPEVGPGDRPVRDQDRRGPPRPQGPPRGPDGRPRWPPSVRPDGRPPGPPPETSAPPN